MCSPAQEWQHARAGPVGLELLLSGATEMAQPNVNATSISAFRVPVPLLAEQKRKKTSWNAETNANDLESSRSAELYVFALLHEQNRDLVNPIDLTQWTFYVLSTARLNELGSQKTITLGSLKKLNPVATNFTGLAKVIRELVTETNRN